MQGKRIIESGYLDEILDEEKATIKYEALKKATRDLQSDDEVSSCGGSQFHKQDILLTLLCLDLQAFR